MQKNSLFSKIGNASLALIIGLAERGALTFIEIVKMRVSGRRTLGSMYKKISELPDFFDYYESLKNLQENSLKTTLWRLQKRGLVERKNNHYYLTKLGLKFIKKSQNKKLQKQWDGKWRIVMFDIPEAERLKREWLRRRLFNLKYKTLQKSVFIGKNPLDEDSFREIIRQKIYQYIRLITVGEIDDDKILDE